MVEQLNVFNRRAHRLHRDRAADALSEHDFLFRETAKRLVDRIDDIKRDFPLALDMGCRSGKVAQELVGRGRIRTLFKADLSSMMARKIGVGTVLVCDEEILPFAPGSLDLVLSNLNLLWINDLPGALIHIRQAMMPDGLFLCSIFGSETLSELKYSLCSAEDKISKKISPRVSPFIRLQDAGSLLQKC